MPRYIDADAVLDILRIFDRQHADLENGSEDFVYGVETAIEVIEDAPTVEVVERKKGSWEYVDDVDYRCSVCHKYAYGCIGEVMSGQYKYCPYCGAEMEVEEDDDGKEKDI